MVKKLTDTEAGTPLTAEEEQALRADLLAWQRADDGTDTKGLLGFRLYDTALDKLPRLLATLDAARSRPATDPAGLRDALAARTHADDWHAKEVSASLSSDWYAIADWLLAEVARVSVANHDNCESDWHSCPDKTWHIYDPAEYARLVRSDRFREAVQQVFEEPGDEFGPAQGYYSGYLDQFIELLAVRLK